MKASCWFSFPRLDDDDSPSGCSVPAVVLLLCLHCFIGVIFTITVSVLCGQTHQATSLDLGF